MLVIIMIANESAQVHTQLSYFFYYIYNP